MKKKSKPKQALLLYEKAIERVVTYQDKVTDKEWLLAANNAADLTGKKLVPEYAPGRYRVDGEIFTKRVNELKAAGVKCIFTYNSFCSGCSVSSYLFTGVTKRIPYFRKGEIALLIWIEGNDICIQAYGDNIYNVKKTYNKPLSTFLTAHHNELPLQDLGRAQTIMSDGTTEFNFRFYWGGTVYSKTIANVEDILDYDKRVNSDKYLTALLPQIQREASLYYEWLILN